MEGKRMTDNVPRITGNVPANHVPETTKLPKRYWGEGDYLNVCLHLDKGVHKRLKIMAIQQETTIMELVNEALVTWVKWLHKVATDDEKGPSKLEIDDVNRLYHEVMREKHKSKMRKALESRRAWHRTYPGKPWPGGMLREIKRDSHVPETEKGENNSPA
jgi:hypothetical protein